MMGLYSEMEDFTKKRYEAFLVGYKMIKFAMRNKGKMEGNKEENKMEIEWGIKEGKIDCGIDHLLILLFFNSLP